MRVRVDGPGGERGVTAVEYALLVAVVVLLLVGGLATTVGAIRERFDRGAGCASVAYRGQGC